MSVLKKVFKNSLDRFRKIRVGYINSQIDPATGTISVLWLDGDVGGQSNICLSLPIFNNVDTPWGIELGYDVGMLGVFGFLTDNHAVLLTTLLSQTQSTPKSSTGYGKTKKILSGQLRFTSKAQASIFFDTPGNLILSTTQNTARLNVDGSINIQNSNSSINMATNGAITITSKSDVNMNVTGNTNLNITGDTNLTTTGNTEISSGGNVNISAQNGNAAIEVTDAGVNIDAGTNLVNINGGVGQVLYTLPGNTQIESFEDIFVSQTVTVGP